jgi:Lsr2
MEAGRRTAVRKAAKAPRAAGSGTDRAAVRAWAAGQGLKVSERGHVSAEVMSKYEAVH